MPKRPAERPLASRRTRSRTAPSAPAPAQSSSSSSAPVTTANDPVLEAIGNLSQAVNNLSTKLTRAIGFLNHLSERPMAEIVKSVTTQSLSAKYDGNILHSRYILLEDPFKSSFHAAMKGYETLWKDHDGLSHSQINFASESIEFDLIGLCNLDNGTDALQSPQATPAPSATHSPGATPPPAQTLAAPSAEEAVSVEVLTLGSASYASELFPAAANANTVVVFELTSAEIAFNENAVTASGFKAAAVENNKTTRNLLEKLLQLERALVFVTTYYGIEIDQIICGIGLTNLEANRARYAVNAVLNAIKHTHFKKAIPLICRAAGISRKHFFVVW